MKVLTIYRISKYYRDHKLSFVKTLWESIRPHDSRDQSPYLKKAKDITDNLYANSTTGVPFPIVLDNIDEKIFALTEEYDLQYSIGNYMPTTVKEDPNKVIESLKLTTTEIEIIVQQNEQLKQENHELTKQVRSLKSTLYKTAVDLNKHYQSVANLLNYAGPRAEHIIKDLAAEIAEDEQ